MDHDKGADLTQMAAELYYLREEAKAAGGSFIAYLIGMAAIEAERLSEQSAREQVEELLQLALSGTAGEAEKPDR